MKTSSFFRWIPTTIVLWTFGVIFTLCAILNWWQSGQAAQDYIHNANIGDSQQYAQWFLRGAIANFAVAVLCIIGWYLMRRRDSGMVTLGALLVMAAAFILCHRSIYWMLKGASFVYWSELVYELPFLVYVIIYAYHESRKKAA